MGWPGPMTQRQYLAWREWTEREWDRPNRADQYVMQLTEVVDHVLDTVSRAFDANKWRIKFGIDDSLRASESAVLEREMTQDERDLKNMKESFAFGSMFGSTGPGMDVMRERIGKLEEKVRRANERRGEE